MCSTVASFTTTASTPDAKISFDGPSRNAELERGVRDSSDDVEMKDGADEFRLEGGDDGGADKIELENGSDRSHEETRSESDMLDSKEQQHDDAKENDAESKLTLPLHEKDVLNSAEEAQPKQKSPSLYDISQEIDASQDAFKVYEDISQNIYKGGASGIVGEEDSLPCACSFDPEFDRRHMACGEHSDCINRSLFIECMEDDCPCGRYCLNRRFQNREYAPLIIVKTEKKGFGLVAADGLTSGQFVMEYIGEVLPYSHFLKRTVLYEQQGQKHFYFMSLQKDEVIDATRKGCRARFMNHSCEPNCILQKWVVAGRMRIGIFTTKAVKQGEELTFDYKFERYGSVAQTCYCGALCLYRLHRWHVAEQSTR